MTRSRKKRKDPRASEDSSSRKKSTCEGDSASSLAEASKINSGNGQKYEFVSPKPTKLESLMDYWCDFCLRTFCPINVHPNVLTLLGLTSSLFMASLINFYNPSLSKEMPGWTYLAMACCVFAHQTFDALDGKQARKLNKASYLGEILDHGSDSLTVVIMVMSLLATLKTGPGWKTLFPLLLSQTYLIWFSWCYLQINKFTYAVGSQLGVTEAEFFMMGIHLMAWRGGQGKLSKTLGETFRVLNQSHLGFLPRGISESVSRCLLSDSIIFLISLIALTALVRVMATWFKTYDAKRRVNSNLQGCVVHLMTESLLFFSNLKRICPPLLTTLMILSSSIIALQFQCCAMEKKQPSKRFWCLYPMEIGSILLFVTSLPSVESFISQTITLEFQRALIAAISIWTVLYYIYLVASIICYFRKPFAATPSHRQ